MARLSLSSLLLFTLLTACVATPAESPEAPRPAHVAMIDDSAAAATTLLEDDARIFVPVGRQGLVHLTRPPASEEGLRFHERVVEYETQEVPSDTRFTDQWALREIRAAAAWEQNRDASDVVVAVVDTGVQLDHPELTAAAWVNEGEEPDNDLDDDENGFVDDVHGWDFVDDDADPRPASGSVSAHGTHVAGIIGATWDNGRGIAGVAPRVRIMALRALAGRRGTSDAVADAVDYAVENGARIVNLSLGGAYSRLLEEAIERAERRNVVVVAATGNSGARRVTFPASSPSPAVIGVAATGQNAGLADFANTGTGMDVTAPGVEILSTVPGGYATFSGTSMAAPHVSGALALALAARSGAGVSISDLLRRMPTGRAGVPRLDLPTLLGSSPRGALSRLRIRRARLTFTAPTASRRPPPQTIQVDADAPLEFGVDAPEWIHPGRCRTAPCRLSFSVDPSELGAGAHDGDVRLIPVGGGPALTIRISLLVGDLWDQALVVELDGRPLTQGASVEVLAGRVVDLRAVRAGLRAGTQWSLDGEPVQGGRLRGIFPRPGRHRVVAVDRQGQQAAVALDVVAEGSNAAPALDLPHRER